MKLFISHSLAPTDWQVATLLSRQAQGKGMAVESSQHQAFVGVDLATVIRQTIASCDFVIAIVSFDSSYTANVQYELNVAASLGKPCLALVEQGVYPFQPLAGVQYVDFVRHDLGPALNHINAILEGRKNQENMESMAKWVIGGGLALLALYLISKSES